MIETFMGCRIKTAPLFYISLVVKNSYSYFKEKCPELSTSDYRNIGIFLCVV